MFGQILSHPRHQSDLGLRGLDFLVQFVGGLERLLYRLGLGRIVGTCCACQGAVQANRQQNGADE